MELQLPSLFKICLQLNLCGNGGELVSSNSTIIGKVKLNPNIKGMPDEGLVGPKLRVELSEKTKLDFAWIAELNVLGDLPWHEGEERQVEVRIMSDEFRNYVRENIPNLLVKYGSQIIGSLELE